MFSFYSSNDSFDLDLKSLRQHLVYVYSNLCTIRDRWPHFRPLVDHELSSRYRDSYNFAVPSMRDEYFLFQLNLVFYKFCINNGLFDGLDFRLFNSNNITFACGSTAFCCSFRSCCPVYSGSCSYIYSSRSGTRSRRRSRWSSVRSSVTGRIWARRLEKFCFGFLW